MTQTLEENLKAVALDDYDGTDLLVVSLGKAIEICQEAVDEAKPKWISVKDRLPETSGELLLHTRSGSRYVGFYKFERKLFICYGVDKKEIDDISVTHWMPLPELKEKL